MNRDVFDAISRVVNESLLLLAPTGEIIALNAPAAALFGRPGNDLEGSQLGPLLDGFSEELDDYLRRAARVSSPIPASLTLDGRDGKKTTYRSDTARATAPGDPVTLIMRLRPHSESVRQFSEFREKIEALAAEIHHRRRVERLIKSQNDALKGILAGDPLPEIFNALLRSLEEVAPSGMAASIQLLDEEGRRLRHLSAPSLPDDFNRAIDGMEIGPEAGSCGTAAFLERPVIVTDIENDPLWRSWKDLALSHDLRACWSTPISSRTGETLGTFDMYFRRPRAPSAADQEMIELVKRTAAIAIEGRRSEERTKELLERETEARAEAERANRLKVEFLATVSHELRTPLTSILGWTRLLRHGHSEAELQEALATIEGSAQSQAQLIDDLLDVSRMSLGKLRLEMGSVDLGSLIRSAVATTRPMALSRRIDVELDVTPDLPPVPGDAQRLHQVVWNLLTNAIKFSVPGGTVRVRLERIDDTARISVVDEGEGIAEEFLPRLFQRFSQAEPILTRSRGGLGLGLSIVKDLVDLHGGSVRAESEPGEGTRFIVELPFTFDPSSSTSLPKQLQLDGSELPDTHVLIVEDDSATRQFLAILLRRTGASVALADSAGSALKAYRSRQPDVLVCDLGLPGASGIDLIRSLHEESDGFPRVAIAISAFRMEGSDTIAAGFHAFVPKPIEPEILIAEIQSRLKPNEPASPDRR